jgi:hypothetical protein
MSQKEQALQSALAEIVLQFSQQKTTPWSTEDVMMVQRANAALLMESDHAMDRQEFSQAQQEAEREEREARREGRERDPPENWEGGPGNSRR